MQNPDVKNSKFGYAHPLVGLEVSFLNPAAATLGQLGGPRVISGKIIRVQEPVGWGKSQDTQLSVAIANTGRLNGEQYSPLDEIAVCR